MSRKFACLYLAVALLVSSIWIASADERDTIQQEVQYSAAVEALDAAGLTSRSSNVLPSGEGLALALELGLPEEETISLSQLPTEALKTSQAQEDAARRKQADTAAAAADAAAKEAARQSLLSEYDGVQLTEAVRLRSAADNDTATSLTIDSGKVACIVTQHGEEMAREIERACGRGATLLKATGSYSGLDKQVVMCACGNKQMFLVQRAARQVDPASFTVVMESSEVLGEGFKYAVRRPLNAGTPSTIFRLTAVSRHF